MKHIAVLLYLGLICFGVYFFVSPSIIILIAAIFGAYMAMNIGANDVANNVGPAVGAKAMTLGTAVLMAAVFEALGALIAGGEVVKTIKDGIIDISGFSDPNLFIYAMLAALLSAAIWLNIATYLKAPVSTTHSIVAGIMGAGIAALGFEIVDWGTMKNIVFSWFVSPIFGGIIAAIFLYLVKILVVYKNDKIQSAKTWVPVFVAIMSWAFGTYIALKGVKNIIKLEFSQAMLIGLILAVIVYFVTTLQIKKSKKLENSREGVNRLFVIPLIFSAALLSFAHGANDVANAIGPLAAIYDAIVNAAISGKVHIPLWIMLLGATGISLGLLFYGPQIIKTVGHEITELDQVRAFCIALSAAITVIIASQLGLPVSSTHIALGGVFGVGFLREYLDKKHHNKKEIYVRRTLVKKIVGAWLITVPVVSFISGFLFLALTYITM